MSRKYKFHNPSGLYFVSFATVFWLDVFIRQPYFDVLIKSIDFCRAEKGMELFAYCFMPSHVHMIFRSKDEKPVELLRDFKKFTAKKMIATISTNAKESRRKWLMNMFEKAGRSKRNISKFQFWQHHNKPIELWTEKVIRQKINYIHNNPIKAGFVTEASHWKYSSARHFQDVPTVIPIDDAGFFG